MIEFLLFCQFIGLASTFTLECIFFVWKPRAAIIPGNVVPVEWPFLLKFPLVYVFPCYTALVGYANLYIHFSIGIIYGTILTPFILRELNLGRKSYRSAGFLRRNVYVLTLEYRACQLLQQRINGFTGKILIPTQTLSGGVFILSCFVIINHRNEMETAATLMMISWSVISAGMWGLALTVGGFVFSNGTKLLNSWKYKRWERSEDRRYMQRFHRSSKPLVISFGKMYTIRKLSVLIFFRGLMRNLMRALLMMNKS